MSAPLQSPPWSEGWLDGLSRGFSDSTYVHTDIQTHTMCIYTHTCTCTHILYTHFTYTHKCSHKKFDIHICMYRRTYVSTYTHGHWDTPHTVSRYRHSSSLSHTETDTEDSSWGTPSPETARGQVSLVMLHNTQHNWQHTTTQPTTHNQQHTTNNTHTYTYKYLYSTCTWYPHTCKSTHLPTI